MRKFQFPDILIKCWCFATEPTYLASLVSTIRYTTLFKWVFYQLGSFLTADSLAGNFIFMRWKRIWRILCRSRDGLPGLPHLSYGWSCWMMLINVGADQRSMMILAVYKVFWERMMAGKYGGLPCLKSVKLIVFWVDTASVATLVGGQHCCASVGQGKHYHASSLGGKHCCASRSSWVGKERTINPPHGNDALLPIIPDR